MCVNRVAFSPDGTLVASACGDGQSNERGDVKVWEAATGKERFGLLGYERAAVGVAFSRNGQRLATVSRDGVVHVWDADIGQGPRMLSADGGVGGSPDGDGGRRMGFSSDGRSLIAVLGGRVRRWETIGWTSSSDPSSTTRPDAGNDASLTLNSDGRFVAQISGRKLLLKDILAGTQVTVAVDADDSSPGDRARGRPSPTAVSEDRRWVAAAFTDGTFAVYDTATKARQFTAHGHTPIAFSPDGERVAVDAGTGQVNVLDTMSGQMRWSQMAHPNAVLHAMAFSPNGRRLATAGSEGTVKVWDAATGDAQLSLRGARGRVYAVAFSTNGQRLASGGNEGCVKVWDAVAGEEILTLTAPGRIQVQDLAFSPNGNCLAARSASRIYIWDAAPVGLMLPAKVVRDVAATHPVAGPTALRHFHFLYDKGAGEESSNRFWREIGRETWEERYEISGRTDRFQVIERVLDGEHSGIIVHKLTKEDIEVLIPAEIGGWLEFRKTGEQVWHRLAQTQPDK
jgi:WD40 repeat protein